MSRKYADFEIWAYPDPPGRDLRAQVRFAGKVEQGRIENPFSDEELDVFRAAASSRCSRDVKVLPPARVSAREMGRKLFEHVFTGAVRDLLKDARLASRKGLRLRLHLSGEAARWPWELMHSPKKFLALSDRTPVVRQVEGEKPRPPLWTPYPLRVLVVISSPRGYSELDGEQELKEIREALGWMLRLGLVKVERLDPPTLEALVDRLDGGHFHVFHFIGHGSFDGRRGALFFEDAEGGADRVEGDSLASVIADDSSLRLVVLNACEGARASEDLFAGVAQSVARQGIPAVVAMQFPISDPMAVRFARRFYRALATGRVVDWAITKARRAMHAAGGVAWAVPVLFLSAHDGRLFRWRPSWGLFGALIVIGGLLVSYKLWLDQLALMSEEICPPAESIRMKFVPLLPGTFTMGSGERGEAPMREVTISEPYCLGAHEVTQRQWEKILGPNRNHSKERGADLPVVSVLDAEVQEFIQKLSEREGGTVYRLPTDVEWEYAARIPEGEVNCRGDRFDGLAPVGFLSPNKLGLRGMIGNAWELVADGYEGTAMRFKRGGSFDSASENCRATTRKPHNTNRRSYEVGFRLVREISPPS